MDEKITGRALLTIPMQENDADALTVGGYLKALLERLWDDGESFSGKRPFGNSGWEYELRTALVLGGAVAGGCVKDGEVQEYGDADDVVYSAIDALFNESPARDELDAILVAACRHKIAEIKRGAE